MLPRHTILGALLLIATTLVAQPTLHLCIVEPSRGYSSGENYGPGVGGIDAKHLVNQLAGRTLADGTAVQPILVIHTHRKDAEIAAKRQDCPLIIELWNHDIGDMADQNGAPVSANSPTAGIPNTVPYHGTPVDSGVEWAMTQNDSRKVIASGYAPPGLRSGRSHSVVKPPPIPVIADQIVDKLNRQPKLRPTPQT